MTNPDSGNNRQFDDELAEFTDRLLNQDAGLDPYEATAQDQTLLELQKTVIQLARAFEHEASHESAYQRVAAHLQQEWGKIEGEKAKPVVRKPWRKRIVEYFSAQGISRNQKIAFNLALASLAVVAIFVFLSILFPNSVLGTNLTGTALGENFPYPILIIAGVVLVFFFWTIWRKR